MMAVIKYEASDKPLTKGIRMLPYHIETNL